MQKSSVLLVAMGALVAGGLGLSVWGNQILFEDLAKDQGRVWEGQALTVSVHMDGTHEGVFAVMVADPVQGTMRAEVDGPGGNQIVRHDVGGETHEGYFDADVAGTYTLSVAYEVPEGEEALVTGYIGPEPDASKRAVAFVSIYVLVVGLAGTLVAIVYAVASARRGRRKPYS